MIVRFFGTSFFAFGAEDGSEVPVFISTTSDFVSVPGSYLASSFLYDPKIGFFITSHVRLLPLNISEKSNTILYTSSAAGVT